ncbi:MAG: hypothetical protein Q8S31_04780 [Alphaproteobacteria bacterium]|nr:hypothetical protein [Alphaproteobacteria bacterium]
MHLNTYTKYSQNLATEYNSKTASLIISQLEYWFSKKKDGFYKFLEPAKSSFYKKGDSWSEEIGICGRTFTRAFDKIGIRYKSKTAFKKTENKFEGMCYASYQDRSTNQTFFIRNHEIAECTFGHFFKKNVPSCTQEKTINETLLSIEYQKKSHKKNIKENNISHFKQNVFKVSNYNSKNITNFTKENTHLQSIKSQNNNIRMDNPENKSQFQNGQNVRSRYIYKYIYLQTTTQTKKPSNLNSISNNEQNQENELVRKVKNIWIEKIGDLGKAPHKLSKTILQAFQKTFNGSLEKWKEYCSKIATSNFLMGKTKSSFKIWILWALKKETYDRINSGELGVSETKQDQIETKNNDVLESIIANHSEKNIQDAFREISKRIESYRFNSWFKGATLQAIKGKTAFLKVKDRLSSDYIRRNFSSEIFFCFNKFNPEIKNIEMFS